MLKNAQKMSRGEGGFTLIELLVVMIIIAILMAVAVPTFLRQKQSAIGTKAKANIKTISTAIEACAASNVDGTYGGGTGADCKDPATLSAQEPAVGILLSAGDGAGTTFAIGNPSAGSANYGYRITATVAASGGPATIIQENNDSGATVKECTGNVKVCGSQDKGKW